MEYARRLIAARGRSLVMRVAYHPAIHPERRRRGIAQLRASLLRRRDLLVHQLHAAVTRSAHVVTSPRLPTLADLRAFDRRVRRLAIAHRARFRDPKWLLRVTGVAGAALLLGVLVFSQSAPATHTPGGAVISQPGDGLNSQTPLAAAGSHDSSLSRIHLGNSAAAKSGGSVPSSPAGTVNSSASAPSQPAKAASGGSTSTGAAKQAITRTVAAVTTTTVTTASRPAATATTPAQTAPKPASPPQGCAATGVKCTSQLIYGDGSPTLSAAPAMSMAAFHALAPQHTTLGQVIARFRAPDSKAALRSLLSVNSLHSLLGGQPSGLACAYYLDSANRTGSALQLCFNSAQTLVQTAVISTGDASASSSG